jgi:hypothetical protein
MNLRLKENIGAHNVFINNDMYKRDKFTKIIILILVIFFFTNNIDVLNVKHFVVKKNVKHFRKKIKDILILDILHCMVYFQIHSYFYKKKISNHNLSHVKVLVSYNRNIF